MAGRGPFSVDLVAARDEELDELCVTPVHVPDDVEGTVIVPPVVPQPLAFEARHRDLVFPREHIDTMEPLAAQSLHRALQLRSLVAQHVGTELSVRPGLVPHRAQRRG